MIRSIFPSALLLEPVWALEPCQVNVRSRLALTRRDFVSGTFEEALSLLSHPSPGITKRSICSIPELDQARISATSTTAHS
ncbi:hypothetical protein AUI06_01965 [archaeon 13_2_20CM_2_52_21]|nr:MAG: hypothetical protein AUI06_01965 [archaeon 13_2_20CM_2_52_21]